MHPRPEGSQRPSRVSPWRGLRSPWLAIILAWLIILAAWLASAEPALAAHEAFRLSDLALDPRILGVGVLLLVAAWLGFSDRLRPRHHRR